MRPSSHGSIGNLSGLVFVQKLGHAANFALGDVVVGETVEEDLISQLKTDGWVVGLIKSLFLKFDQSPFACCKPYFGFRQRQRPISSIVFRHEILRLQFRLSTNDR